MTTNDSPCSPSPATHHPPPTTRHSFPYLTVNALALVLAAIWLRGHCLGNIPGVNGDEAWYGVEAWRMLHGGTIDWHTPTGNPLNPLFVGPLALLHLWLPPSIVLLRCVALAGGLAALAVNWLLCRWVFDRRTATISTVALAILPINIAYSRLAWDASQSLAVTLPVVYFALAAVRFPHRFSQWIATSVLALAVAFWVHPTNIFVGAVVVVVVLGRRCFCSPSIRDGSQRFAHALCVATVVLAGVLFAIWIGTAHLAQGPLAGRIAERLDNLGKAAEPSDSPPTVVLYARLFTGGTIYRYIAGSRSWFEWPLPADKDGLGLDVAVFWVALFASAWLIWQSRKVKGNSSLVADAKTGTVPRLRRGNPIDVTLLAAWALQLATFLVVAGPQAMAPGQERFTIGLVGPTVLLVSRGAALAWEAASTRWRIVLATATVVGWFVLADFHAHFFQFIERSGGEAHFTFRTAAAEPKQAALQFILENTDRKGQGERQADGIWIVCSEWWIRHPIRYLALPRRDVFVIESPKLAPADSYRQALAEGRVWFVEFCDTDAERQVESQFFGGNTTCRRFPDYGGRPLLSVFHVDRR